MVSQQSVFSNYLARSAFLGIVFVLATLTTVGADEFIGPRPFHPDTTSLFWSAANGVSEDGSVVVGHALRNTWRRPRCVGFCTVRDHVAFRWSIGDTEFTELEAYSNEGFDSQSMAASGDGSVIVGWVEESGNDRRDAFRWMETSGRQGLGIESVSSEATAVSVDGSVVVGMYTKETATEAFSWTETGGLSGLGHLDGHQFSRANAVSNDGTMIAGVSRPTADALGRAFVWTDASGIIGLSGPDGSPEYGTEALAMSSDGAVIVGNMARLNQLNLTEKSPVRWMQTSDLQWQLDVLDVPGRYGTATDMTADGSIIVGTYMPGGLRAFAWDGIRGARDLQDLLEERLQLVESLDGWRLEQALGISSNGKTIVGRGQRPNTLSSVDAWVVQLTFPLFTGDFDADAGWDAADIDILSTAVRGDSDVRTLYDINADSLVDWEDRRLWVEEIKGTFFGDLDLDGEVAFSDFVTLAENFGQNGGWAQGDLSGDGEVAFSDFAMLASNYGRHINDVPVEANTVTVPEPHGLPMALFVFGSVVWRRRVATKKAETLRSPSDSRVEAA